ncbi:MAG: monovalent cation:proton antiporter-2 (CPA2) family protein [bacterium]
MSDFMLLAFIILGAGIIAVPIASRLGLGSVLGYLIAGILISPILTYLHVDVVAIQHFAEFGVVMMLFLVGLELEPKRLWQMRMRLLGLGGGQVLVTAAAIMVIVILFGLAWHYALTIGLILALSSTAITLQTLNEKGLMKSDGGQASFSVLLFQDVAVIPILALLPLLAMPELLETIHHAAGTDPATDHSAELSLVAGLPMWQSVIITLGAIVAVILVGSYLTRPLFRFVASAQLRELFTATALGLVIGIALLMTLVGLSPALGTFLAGVVLANSEYRHELESDIDPFRGLLLGVFFITVGASINFALLFGNIGFILSLTVAVMAVKAAVLFVIGSIFNLKGASRWLLALGLAQAGEFGFVLLSFTVTNGILPAAVADQLLLVVALSMLLTPILFIIYDRVLVPAYLKRPQQQADSIEEKNHIIVAGHGRMGGIIDRMLKSANYNATVIDYSSRQLEILRKFGAHAYFGDATRPDLLKSAGIEEAKLFIIAIDNKEQITELVKYVTRHYPTVHIIARAIDRDHVYQLWAHGCRDIIRETYDSALRMGRSAFVALGTSLPTAEKMSAIYKELDTQRMIDMADVYDLNIPSYENEALLDKVRKMRSGWEEELRQRVGQVMQKKD